jgi:hypothetical protein
LSDTRALLALPDAPYVPSARLYFALIGDFRSELHA